MASNTETLYNLHLIDLEDCDEFGMPMLAQCNPDIENVTLTQFRNEPGEGRAAHFFMEDSDFNSCWTWPQRYGERLKGFDFTLTPDFSCYLDMPWPMQAWNVYRSRAMGCIWQDMGLQVVPTVTWGEEETYEFAFDGVPEDSTIAFSSVGMMRGENGRDLFRRGAEEACVYLEPRQVICYGTPCDFDANGAKVIWHESDMQKRFDELKEAR